MPQVFQPQVINTPYYNNQQAGFLSGPVGQTLLGGLFGGAGKALSELAFGAPPEQQLQEMQLEAFKQKQAQEMDARAKAEGWTPEEIASGSRANTADAQQLARAAGKQAAWEGAQLDPEMSALTGQVSPAIPGAPNIGKSASPQDPTGAGQTSNKTTLNVGGTDVVIPTTSQETGNPLSATEAAQQYYQTGRNEGSFAGPSEAIQGQQGATSVADSYQAQAQMTAPVEDFNISQIGTPGYLDQFLPRPKRESLDASKLNPVDAKRAQIKSQRILGAISTMAMIDDPKMASDPKALGNALAMLNTVGSDIDDIVDLHNISQGRDSSNIRALGGSMAVAADLLKLSQLKDPTVLATLSPAQQGKIQAESQVIINRLQKLRPFELDATSRLAGVVSQKFSPTVFLQHYQKLAENKAAVQTAGIKAEGDLREAGIRAQVDMMGHQLTALKIRNEAKMDVVRVHDIQFDNQMEGAKFEQQRMKDEAELQHAAARLGLQGQSNEIQAASVLSTAGYQRFQSKLELIKAAGKGGAFNEDSMRLTAISQELKDLQAANQASTGFARTEDTVKSEAIRASRLKLLMEENAAIRAKQMGASMPGGAQGAATHTQAAGSQTFSELMNDPYVRGMPMEVYNLRFHSRSTPRGLEMTEGAITSNDGKGASGPTGSMMVLTGEGLAKAFDITKPVPTLEQFAQLSTSPGHPTLAQAMSRRHLEQLHSIFVNMLNERKKLNSNVR